MKLLPLVLLLLAPLSALQTAPWFGPLFQPQVRIDGLYQYAPKLDTIFGDIRVDEQRETALGSLMITPWINWSAEIEIGVTHTHVRDVTFFDFGRLTARYLWLNDVDGDPFSLATGASITLPSDTSLKEPATFEIGLPTLTFHTAIGKEIPRGFTWKWHLWAFGALHVPFNGPPHLQGLLAAEWNTLDCHFIRGFVNGHLGLGDRGLNPATFHGYGPIQARRVFVGIRYARRAFFNGNIHIQYEYTPYAKNSPLEVQRIYIGLFYPISL